MENNNNNMVYYLIFFGIILISIVLIASTASITINQDYEFLVPEIDTSNESYGKEYDFIILNLENSNSIFPKRVELKPIYLCAYHTITNELLYSTELNSNKRSNSISSEIFDLNEKFIDVSPNSNINVIYSSYISRYDLSIAKDNNYQYRIEYRVLTENVNSLYRYGLDEDVCNGEVTYNTIFPLTE